MYKVCSFCQSDSIRHTGKPWQSFLLYSQLKYVAILHLTFEYGGKLLVASVTPEKSMYTVEPA